MCGIMGVLSDGRPEETRAAVRDMMAASRASRSRRLREHRDFSRRLAAWCWGTRGFPSSTLVMHRGSRCSDAESGSWLAFNGEIYNFRQLRGELERLGVKFATSGDSEVLLKALVQWGERALQKIEGMFAFAFWDGRSATLLLARDRMGMKPLYYCTEQRWFCALHRK